MKIAVFGATGGVGRHVVEQALERGHQVIAYARDGSRVPHAGQVEVVVGQLDDTKTLARCIEHADAVVNTLGARTNSPDQPPLFERAVTQIVAQMKQHDVRRLVSIAGAGVILEEDEMTLGRRIIGVILSLVAKHVTRAKELEVEVIRRSDLDWVIVRPPRIVEGAATKDYEVAPWRVPGSKISQGDVAHFMLDCVEQDDWVGRAPLLGYA